VETNLATYKESSTEDWSRLRASSAVILRFDSVSRWSWREGVDDGGAGMRVGVVRANGEVALALPGEGFLLVTLGERAASGANSGVVGEFMLGTF